MEKSDIRRDFGPGVAFGYHPVEPLVLVAVEHFRLNAHTNMARRAVFREVLRDLGVTPLIGVYRGSLELAAALTREQYEVLAESEDLVAWVREQSEVLHLGRPEGGSRLRPAVFTPPDAAFGLADDLLGAAPSGYLHQIVPSRDDIAAYDGYTLAPAGPGWRAFTVARARDRLSGESIAQAVARWSPAMSRAASEG